jgi:hypothetical protein
LKTRLPVRSALFKQRTGGLVVRWVTTSEYPLLYVFALLLAQNAHCGINRVDPFIQFPCFFRLLISEDRIEHPVHRQSSHFTPPRLH